MDNLIFDGNYLFHKNVNTAHNIGRLYGDFWTLLDNNIQKYVAMNRWERVIIVVDSRKKSWRKDFLDNYKAGRDEAKREEIDWDFAYKTFYEWVDSLRDRYIVLLEDRVEGDDWIATLLQKFNKEKKSNVVIASDGDLKQLCKYKLNGKKSWINIQISDINGSEKVFLPLGWQLWLNEFESNMNTDIFDLDNGNITVDFFKKITNMWQTEEVDHNEILFIKLVWGDKSDKIPSIRQKIVNGKDGPKLQNIGEATAKKVWNHYKENYSTHFKTSDPEFINNLIECVSIIDNTPNMSDGSKKNMRNQIERNISLIELNHRHYPDYILEKIVEKFNETFEAEAA